MKLVCGAGINDLNYRVTIREEMGKVDGRRKQGLVWRCPYYTAWASMLTLCFSEKLKQKSPTYKDVTCCKEWLRATVFKSWMIEQDWKGKQLDKDIIVTGNKIYSPDTCAFVLASTNNFILESKAIKGEWPIGVSWNKHKKKFVARCCNPFTKKGEYLLYAPCPKEAHEAWRKQKHDLAQLVAETETDPRVVEALKKRYSYEEWYKHNPI